MKSEKKRKHKKDVDYLPPISQTQLFGDIVQVGGWVCAAMVVVLMLFISVACLYLYLDVRNTIDTRIYTLHFDDVDDSAGQLVLVGSTERWEWEALVYVPSNGPSIGKSEIKLTLRGPITDTDINTETVAVTLSEKSQSSDVDNAQGFVRLSGSTRVSPSVSLRVKSDPWKYYVVLKAGGAGEFKSRLY